MSSADPESFIFHLAIASDWSAAQAIGAYRVSTRGRSLDDVGFIHCSYRHQLWPVARAFYADETAPLVVLTIELARLESPVVAERPPGSTEEFPHVYGELPVSAVVATEHARIDAGELHVAGDAGPW